MITRKDFEQLAKEMVSKHPNFKMEISHKNSNYTEFIVYRPINLYVAEVLDLENVSQDAAEIQIEQTILKMKKHSGDVDDALYYMESQRQR